MPDVRAGYEGGGWISPRLSGCAGIRWTLDFGPWTLSSVPAHLLISFPKELFNRFNAVVSLAAILRPGSPGGQPARGRSDEVFVKIGHGAVVVFVLKRASLLLKAL